jgi:hypothetical protein
MLLLLLGKYKTLSDDRAPEIVESNNLPNCPINQQDRITTEDILGPVLGSLKGKTTQTSPEHVHTGNMNIPISIMSRYQKITIAEVM